MPYLSCPGCRSTSFRAAPSVPNSCPTCAGALVVHEGERPYPSRSIFEGRRGARLAVTRQADLPMRPSAYLEGQVH